MDAKKLVFEFGISNKEKLVVSIEEGRSRWWKKNKTQNMREVLLVVTSQLDEAAT